MNSKIKVKNSLSELQRSDGTFTNSDGEMINILNYFGTVFMLVMYVDNMCHDGQSWDSYFGKVTSYYSYLLLSFDIT